ncbi:MAG: IMP dehydrogenase, partial [Hyphomicrobiales bacterium]|nr:IMP dehydrogenase [Hyphomicrobiales bacterium]
MPKIEKSPAAAIEESLTFDDVLLLPGASDVQPADVDVTTRLTRNISLNVPLLSAAMDTVTEADTAIALAQAGGIGIVHRNLPPEVQAAQIRRVKRYESGMVDAPITIRPDATLAEAFNVMKQNRISGIPVTQENGKLVGILTNRDVRFAENQKQKVSDLMTSENLVTAPRNISKEKAKKLLHQHRIEKLLVVDAGGHCIGLITVKDIEKSQLYPTACKDE